VFIASTAEDLDTFRQAARDAAERAGFFPVMFERCHDWYAGEYGQRAGSGMVHDPQGPSNGSGRVWRGGSWNNDLAGAVRRTPPHRSLERRLAPARREARWRTRRRSAGVEVTLRSIGANPAIYSRL
jgi:hypothetical protein